VLYLSVPDAIPALLQDRPDAKFIAIVRNPIDVFLSWHNHCLNWLDENQPDVERAWSLQHLRADGWAIPPGCKVPFHLQYETICSFGMQVQRLYACVPERQRLIIVFDDLAEKPVETYQKVCSFLGVRDGGPGIRPENARVRPKSRTVVRLFKAIKTNKRLNWIWLRGKPFLNARGVHLMEMLPRYNFAPQPKRTLSEAFRYELNRVFGPDVALLESTIGRDLSHWIAEDERLSDARAV
jgi:hypothetical protein